MKSIGRRCFFRSLLTGSVLAGTGAAQAVPAAPQNSGNATFSSRRMDEMANFEHYSKWLEQHPMQYISPMERLQEK